MNPSLNEIIQWANQAGEILRQRFGQVHEIHYKGLVDLTTEADHQSEDYLIGQIRSSYPEHAIITEESGSLAGRSDHCWYVDPLDGTINYSHGLPFFAVSIAYAEQDRLKYGVIYNPISNECFTAEAGQGAFLNGQPIHVSQVAELIGSLLVTGFPYDKSQPGMDNTIHFNYLTRRTQGVRRLGSAAMDMAFVAAGRLEGYWEIKLSAWDLAAGALIVQEAGGVVADLNGGDQYMAPPYAVIAANPLIYPQLLAALHESDI
jgi:myo-inositol-1(or 4)-monophosphatase